MCHAVTVAVTRRCVYRMMAYYPVVNAHGELVTSGCYHLEVILSLSFGVVLAFAVFVWHFETTLQDAAC